MSRLCGVWFVILLFGLAAAAQTASLNTVLTDSMSVKKITLPATKSTKWKPDPQKATLLSLALPGLGQAYNKKYWKIPVLAAGFGTLGYFIGVNNDYYKAFRDASNQRARGEEDPYINVYPDISQLRVQREFYRRNRDLLFILTAGLYALNLVDAAVDAHMAGFNVTDDLTAGLIINPTPAFSIQRRPNCELRLVKRF